MFDLAEGRFSSRLRASRASLASMIMGRATTENLRVFFFHLQGQLAYPQDPQPRPLIFAPYPLKECHFWST